MTGKLLVHRLASEGGLQGGIRYPLQTYILAEPDTPFLALHRRDGADFRRETLSGRDAVLDLPEAGIAIQLAELYRDVG